jgi:acyl-CoA synthetase (AMP-forming)/AMP-acid ligase II
MRLVNRAAAGEGHLPPDTLVRLGGSAVGQSLRLRITRHLSPNLHVAYATSDFGPIATAGPEHHADKPDALGVVHPGVQFEIVGEDGGGLPHGETGQIRLRGPGMSTRYLDDAEATARAFRGGWFDPGDMGFIDADGVGYFEGRSDDMMNFASINVFPSEIERVIEGFSGVTECAAFAIRSRSFGEIPAVAVVGPPASVEREIAVYARQQLGLRAPRKVILVDAIPRNSAGKIDRAALERMAVPDKSNEAGKLDGG